MSPALNGSLEIHRFERSDIVEIRNRIMFIFCPGLPQCIRNTFMVNLLGSSFEFSTLIAERLSVRQLILHRISPSVCIYVCVTLRNVMLRNVTLRNANVSRLGMQFTASTCSRWRHTSYMDAAFVLLAHEGLEIRTNRSLLFTQVGLLQLQCD